MEGTNVNVISLCIQISFERLCFVGAARVMVATARRPGTNGTQVSSCDAIIRVLIYSNERGHNETTKH
jgi:hypothetical protein